MNAGKLKRSPRLNAGTVANAKRFTWLCLIIPADFCSVCET